MAKRHYGSKKHRHDGVHHGGAMSVHSKPEGHHGSVPHHSPLSNVAHDGYKMRGQEQYAGREETKMAMARDGAMIKEDWNATALLPTGVIDRDWPRASSYNLGMTPTLFTGAQAQIRDDEDDMKREFNPGKY